MSLVQQQPTNFPPATPNHRKTLLSARKLNKSHNIGRFYTRGRIQNQRGRKTNLWSLMGNLHTRSKG